MLRILANFFHRGAAWPITVALIPFLFQASLSAQTTGTIVGQISDQSGAAVANATVTAINMGTRFARKAVTNSEGEYLIPSLPIGEYQVTVNASGFKEFTQTGITLQVAQNARVDGTLQLGSVTESVNVSGSALRVDTESTTVGGVIDRTRIADIPLNGRNVLSLAQLLPGVGQANIPTVVTFSRSGPTFTVSGSRENANNVQLDGTTFVGAMGNVAQNLPSPDSLQEFRILTNTYSAEYGRASGGVLLAVTKSGSNQVHGSLWEFLRNDALNARNYFNPGPSRKPYLRQNQFGGSFGGPVVLPGYNGKDKTFFFVSYQGLRIRQQNNDVSTPPTAAELGGDFSAISTPIIDPDTGMPFPGNMIPSDRLDPLALTMSQKYLPVNPGTGTLQQLVSNPTNTNQVSVKLDQKLSGDDNLSFRYYRDKDLTLNTRGGDSIPLKGSEATTVTSYSVNETHVFNPHLLNELHFSYTEPNSLFVASKNNLTPTQLGAMFAQDGPVPLVPNVTVNGFFSITPEFPLPEPDKEYQFDEKVSWITGRHAFRFGGEYMHIHHLSEGQFNSSGGFTFDGSFTGNAMADFVLGRPVNLFQQSPLHDESVTAEYQFFAQDDFKVSRRLTLNLGLRYELDTPPVQVENWTSSIRPNVGCSTDCEQSKLFPTAPPGLVFPGDPGVPRGLVPADKSNFGPRIGFAWDPTGNGRTSIRGAYAIFYDYTGAIVSATVNQTEPYVLPISFTPPSFVDPYQGQTDPFPLHLDLNNPQFVYPMQAYSVSPDFKNGRIHEYNFNIQRQFGSDWLTQIGYYGKIGRDLSDDHEGNPAVYGPGATPENVQSRRPFFPQYYSSIGLITSDASSNYNSLQASVDKKFSHGYTLQLAYTYSKSIDNRSGFSVDGVSGANPHNYLDGERGLSDFNQKHILAINGVWDLPFLKHNGLLTTAFGGWRLAGTMRFGSGFPFSVTSGQDYALEGTGRGTAAERPNIIDDPNLPGGRSRAERVTEYFNTAAFAAPTLGTYGDAGRNIIIGPAFKQTDLAVLKQFQLPKENWGRFEFRLETFNLFNNVNFANPNGTFGSPSFGRILTAQAGRIVQLGLRYDF